MRTRLPLSVLPVLVVATLGCASFSLGPACPAEETLVAVPVGGVEPTCAEARLGPDELYEQATRELARGDLEAGYRNLALVHILYPESPQDEEAFVLAARVFRKNHYRHRMEPGSVWAAQESGFMFEWLAGFFREEDPFPQQQVNAMFLGMHYGIFRDFLGYASSHARDRPELSRWTLSAEKDNGVVESVTAVPRGDASV